MVERDRRHLDRGCVRLSLRAARHRTDVTDFHLQQNRGWSQAQTSAAFVPFAVALPVTGRMAGLLIAGYGASAVTTCGLALSATGLALLALTGPAPHTPYVYGLLPGLLTLPAGGAASSAGAAVLATHGVEPQQTGLAGGVMNTAMELGATVIFTAALTLVSDATSLAATTVAFAAAAFLNARQITEHRSRKSSP
ncbi:hypothetical protein [Streptomyces rishiriensis]|uniref:MFS family permease n=1 Tax=Streptomyces rishiriensis TaxID=68264 RepID=A0ABU0NHT6_STRRH|nr:hypothetical protein [Streptomyces rishiriensis]MDQ0578692.1 MFS family permease [Streptomyces rishiriensis]